MLLYESQLKKIDRTRTHILNMNGGEALQILRHRENYTKLAVTRHVTTLSVSPVILS